MTLFLITYFLIYGGGHLFMLHLLQAALQKNAASWLLPATLWSILMVLAPILTRLLERNHHETAAQLMALTGYCWMGWLFLFCSVAVLLKFCQAILCLVRRLTGLPDFSWLPPGQLLVVCMLVATTAFIWGLFEAQAIRTEKVTLTTEKLPVGEKLRVVLISDLHVGLIIGESFVRKVTDKISAAKPDLIVSTGDLVDSNLQDSSGISAVLQQLQPPLGKIAIPGNHEYYAGYRQAKEFTEESGFKMLRYTAAALGERLWVIGIDDPAGRTKAESADDTENSLLAAAPQDRFILLLKHRPELESKSLGRFDLQLSGHMHNGQIFPFGLITRLKYRMPAGLTAFKQDGWLYISSGTGTWGPPIRFLAPPEITVIDLVGHQ